MLKIVHFCSSILQQNLNNTSPIVSESTLLLTQTASYNKM